MHHLYGPIWTTHRKPRKYNFMDIRQISPNYAVSPQIDPEDVQTIAASGFTTIICNRPDAEIPPSHHADVIKNLAEAAGLTFVELPITHAGLSQDMVAQQRAVIDASDGPTFAYCASGTRCSIVWSLGQAGDLPSDEIIAATSAWGYDLRGLAPQLDAIAKQKDG